MNPAPSAVFRILAWSLHLLVLGLLGLAAGRALAGSDGHSAAITAACAVTGAVYVLGAALLSRGGPPRLVAGWLAVLCACWLVVMLLTQDGIWLAFPLFFLQLHLLPRRWGLAAVVASTAAAVATFAWHQRALDVGAVVGPVLGAAVAVATVLGYQALYRESEQRRSLIEELTAARADLAAADHHAGVLAERERLAREIHDTLAQGLSSIQLLLRAAQRSRPGAADPAADPAAGYVERARQTAQDNLAEARRFVAALTPPDLADSSLPAALERLCATTTERSGLTAHFHLAGTPTPLPAAREAALLRIAQSAVANTVRHARAARVEVTLSYMDSEVALDIVDDGVGFEPAAAGAPTAEDGGFGLATMRARAGALGGRLTVESAPGAGTAIAVLLPDRPRGGVEGGQS